MDRRRKIEFTVEPGFYRVLIGRDDVGEMAGLQRSQMGIDNFRGKHRFITAAAFNREDSPAGIGEQKKHRGECKPSPRRASGKDNGRSLRTYTGQNFLAKSGGGFLIDFGNVDGRA